MIPRTPHKLVITLENVSPADAIALKKMFEYMQYLGNIGSSRLCSFYADGDGSFRPKVSFDYPIELPDVSKISGVISREDIINNGRKVNLSIGDFTIDSDSIAWEVYHDPEPEGWVRPMDDAPQFKSDKK
jgi:hypothetical protein